MACRKLAFKVELRASFEDGFGRMCSRANMATASSKSLQKEREKKD